MGADINFVYQVREQNQYQWKNIFGSELNWDSPLYIHRNYSLFGVLAGVRGPCEEDPISDQRGFPSDFEAISNENEEVLHGKTFMGWHDFGWVTLTETARRSEPALDALTTNLTNIMIEHGVGPDDVRLVFGFDS